MRQNASNSILLFLLNILCYCVGFVYGTILLMSMMNKNTDTEAFYSGVPSCRILEE